MPRSEKNFIPKVSTLSWGRALGPLGGLSTGQLMLPAPHGREEKREYFGISNCVFNFNFLALVVSEILRASLIYTRGAYAPLTPPIG